MQRDLLEGLNTRVVVPLVPVQAAPKPARRLNPVFRLGEADHVMVTQFMAAVALLALGAPVGSLDAAYEEISAALDML